MKKKGISLILLVITIIIIIIIASAVILNLNNNNPVNKAKLANVQSTRDSLKSGINLYIGKIMVKENGNHNASTMILGKNTQVIDYSIIHDYSIYETIRGNLNIWQLDYSAINEKVNLKLDIYDNNSRWYIDEWGNPFLVYNSLTNVSSYLKTEDSSAILSSVQDFVVVLDNVEFAENSTLGKANTYKSNITSAVKRYLASNSNSLNEIADSSSVRITVNGVDTNLYKLNISNLNTKVGTNLTDTYENADWYIDENGNTYLIYDNESNIPEEIKSGVSTNSYVTVNGGTITAFISNGVLDNSQDNEENIVTTYEEYSIGEMVTVNNNGIDEMFYVMGDSGDSVSLITKYFVHPTTYMQLSNFSYQPGEKTDWNNAINVAKQYGNNLNSVGNLLPQNLAQTLDASIRNMGYYYWLGTQYSTSSYCVNNYGSIGTNSKVAQYPIRPVITISKSLVKYDDYESSGMVMVNNNGIDELFYVLSDSGDTVSLITKYFVHPTTYMQLPNFSYQPGEKTDWNNAINVAKQYGNNLNSVGNLLPQNLAQTLNASIRNMGYYYWLGTEYSTSSYCVNNYGSIGTNSKVAQYPIRPVITISKSLVTKVNN